MILWKKNQQYKTHSKVMQDKCGFGFNSSKKKKINKKRGKNACNNVMFSIIFKQYIGLRSLL